MSDLIEIEGAFCAKVTEALKVQSSDLRKEARILRAFREANEAQQAEIARLREALADIGVWSSCEMSTVKARAALEQKP